MNIDVTESLSARRAWIEIGGPLPSRAYVWVALRKESVDRNYMKNRRKCDVSSRSPQGERG